MFERKEKEVNSYYPTFFYTFLNIPDDPQYLANYPLDERSEAFFLHEYIHYLQDLTTPSGYSRIESIVDQVKWGVMEANRRKNLRIPLSPDSTWNFNMKPNAACLRLSQGDMKKKTVYGGDVVYGHPKELKQTEVVVPIKDGKDIRVNAVTTFVFEDNRGDEYEYKIGELAISESMAYIIENHIYPGVLAESTDFPYNVVRNIIRWKCPKAENDMILVAICDVCLLYSFPGIAFFFLMEYLESYENEITPGLIYMYGLGKDMVKKMSTRFWQEQLTTTNELAIKQLRDYFNHPYWSDTRDALTTSLINAYSLRKNKPTFILDIMKGGRICHNDAFQEALSLMGCMAVCTANEQLFYFVPRFAEHAKVDADWFVSLYQLYRILFTKDAIENAGDERFVRWRCLLKNWCQNSFNKQGLTDITTTSRNCIQSPWMNVSDELMAQCSFGRLWAAYNLDRVKLKPDYKQ